MKNNKDKRNKNNKDMKTQIMNLFRMMGKSLKSLMQIFATFATSASANFVGKESNESTVRYALWSRISLTKPLQNPYLTLTRFRLTLGSNLSRFSLASLICLCMLTVGVGNAWGTIDANSTWTPTAWANIPNGATFIIATNCDYAMYNGNGTSNPTKVSISYNSTTHKITVTTDGKSLDDIAWIYSKPSTTVTIKSFADNTQNLYTSNNAQGLKVGTTACTYSMGAAGKLLVASTYSRYVGTYNSDWRSYDSETHSNYTGNCSGQYLIFYVLTTKDCEDPDSDLSISVAETTINAGVKTQLSTTGGNGSTVTYTVTSANNSYASIDGSNKFSATRPGTYTVQASQEKSGGVCGGTSTVNITVRYQVKWSVNGDDSYSEGTPTAYISEYDTKVTALPTAPGSALCDGSKIFVGWTATAIPTTTNTKPADLFVTLAAAPNVTNNVTYYAVFAAGGVATFDATSASGLTGSGPWTHSASGVSLTINAGQRYTGGTPNTWSVNKGSYATVAITSGNIAHIVAELSESKYYINSVGAGTLATSSTTQTITNAFSSSVRLNAQPNNSGKNQIRMTTFDVTYVSATPAYATSCCNQLAAPTNPGETPNASGAVLTWDAVVGATGYEVNIDDGGWASTGNGTTCNYTVTGKACGGTSVSWQVRATGDGSTNCAKGTATSVRNFNTTACACTSQYTYFWGTSITNVNPAASAYASHHFECFTTWNGTEGKTGLITLPNSDTENYWFVGYNGYYYNSDLPGGGRSWCTAIYDMNYANSQSDGKVLGWNSTAYPRGATGYIRIYSNNTNSNKYAAFIPSGYILRWKNNNTWGSYPFTDTGANNYWETSIQQLGANISSSEDKVYVGLPTSGMAEDYTWCGKSEEENLLGIGKKTGASTWAANGVVAADAGQKGKWRIVITDNATNWNLHFVPYWEASYDVNGGEAISPAAVNVGPVSCEGDASARQITMPAAPSYAHHSFNGWSDGVTTRAAGATVSLTQNTTFTAQWSVLPQYTVTLNAGANGSLSVDKASSYSDELGTVTITITPSSGYQLSSISAVDGSSNPVSLSGTGNTRTFTMPASNVTVTSAFVVRTDYVLVESALDDYSGEYLIVCNNSGTEGMYALSDRNGSIGYNTYGTYTNVWDYYDSSSKTIESNSTTDAMKMVIEPGDTDGKYTIYFEGDKTYLGMLGTNASTGDKLRFLSSPVGSENVYEWSISLISETTRHRISIWNTAATPARYDLERNGTSGYRLYQYTQQNPELYKKVETCSKLAAPTGLSAGSLTQTIATLSWTAVANASGYEVSLDNGSSWTSAGTNTSYSATSLTQGTTYNWKVRATGDGSTYCAKGTAASSSFTTKHAVKVTYNGNGHTSGQYPVTGGKVDLTEGDSYTILGNTGNGGAALAKTGYTFDGWHNSSTYSATPAYTIGNSITVTEDITLYANWKPKKDTFVDAVHNTATQYGEGYNYTIPSCSDQTRYTSGTCEETHYKFIGWALAGDDLSNPSNIIHAGDTQTATGTDASPKTYYAVWAEEL